MSQGNASAGISFGLDSDKVFKYRDSAMCNRWTTDYASFLMCDVKIIHNPVGNYIVNGRLKSHLSSIASNGLIKYWAANSPTYSASYAGSGLPFPNENVAFDQTPNQGVAKIIDGQFTLNIFYPIVIMKIWGRNILNHVYNLKYAMVIIMIYQLLML